ncbi:MAG: prephenate dehydrogenase/arogenate dehydrogenase family protein [Proteobacteria bacterium]|nr:prephenate dehydrogenase/arogenate dehydrogenase family protein [Verrucomicrobiota bacterium]NBU08067.1 prephenate dehydrogenase/arogenate dehydrogenase family protein [Pseudomonadota bacterium]
MHFPKVTLVGVGLLGGSLGLALKQRRLAGRVEGYVRREASIAECERLGVVDRATTDLLAAVREADLVVFCTPIAQMRSLAEQCVPALKAGALVTDVGSVKGSVVAELEPIFSKAGALFIGSHPMAGAEKTGPAAARPDLFERAVCVVTPGAKTPVKLVKLIEEFWAAVGGRTLRLTPDQHDSLVARSSHLPHVVAAELANYVLSPAHPKEQPALCATGFRDTTRIAAGSPEMWRDIALANRKHLARSLGVFIEDLQEFQRAVESGDAKAMDEFFETAKHRRDQWVGNGGSPE